MVLVEYHGNRDQLPSIRDEDDARWLKAVIFDPATDLPITTFGSAGGATEVTLQAVLDELQDLTLVDGATVDGTTFGTLAMGATGVAGVAHPLLVDAAGRLTLAVQHTEGSVFSPGHTGSLSLGVQRAADTTPSGVADGDYQSILFDPSGFLKVNVKASALPTDAATQTTLAALLAELQLKADLTETQPVSVASLPLPSGAATETTLASVLSELQSISQLDDAPFTVATGSGVVMMAQTTSDAVNPGDAGALQMTLDRALYINIRNASGTELGNSAGAPLRVDPTGATTQPVSGTVTANAGTNLNTSLLALEAGGNLAAAASSLNTIDDWDESDRAKVNIIVGQAGVSAGAGAVAANTPRMTLASDDPAVTSLQLIDDTVHASDAAFSKALAIGAQFDDTSPGTTTENSVRPLRMSTRRELHVQIRDAAGNERGANVTAGGAVNVVLASATTTTVEVIGDVASDAPIASAPVTVGGRASTATPTAVSADGDAVNLWLDRSGGLVNNGRDAHDAALDANTNPLLTGGRASAAAPSDVSGDGDAVRAWRLRNGAAATVVTAAGALIGGDATNGLDVDVTRTPGATLATNSTPTAPVLGTDLSSDSTWTQALDNGIEARILIIDNGTDAPLEIGFGSPPTTGSGNGISMYINPRRVEALDLKANGMVLPSGTDVYVRRFSTTPVTGHVMVSAIGV